MFTPQVAINTPKTQPIRIDTSVLLFALAVIIAVALSLGLFAAWRARVSDLVETLRAGSRTYAGTSSTQRLRGLLVVGEIATTFVILVGAGLLIRSFVRLISMDPGFRQDGLVTMEFSPPVARDAALDESAVSRQVRSMDDIMNRLRAIPGVQNVGLAGAFPVARGDDLADGQFLLLDGQKPRANFEEWARVAQNPSRVGHAYYCVAGEEYLRTLGIPLLRGRLFGGRDSLNSPNVAVISQALAKQRWPSEDPIGHIVDFGNMDGNLKPLTIVGVVGDVRARGLDFPPIPVIYVDYRQRGLNANSTPTIVVRSTIPALMSFPPRTVSSTIWPRTSQSNSPPSLMNWAVGLPIADFFFSW